MKEKLASLRKRLSDLQTSWESLNSIPEEEGKRSFEVRRIDEELTQIMLAADGITYETLREERRAIVKEVQALLGKVDKWKAENAG